MPTQAVVRAPARLCRPRLRVRADEARRLSRVLRLAVALPHHEVARTAIVHVHLLLNHSAQAATSLPQSQQAPVASAPSLPSNLPPHPTVPPSRQVRVAVSHNSLRAVLRR